MKNRPAVFFDRDGVLNEDIGYLYKKEDFKWVQGAIETIKYFNEHEYLVFVITNQSGVARGYYTEVDVQKLHGWMNAELAKYDAHIDEFFYCPHHVKGIVAEYSCDCACRKPKTGMLDKAFAEYSIDKDRSIMIGDKESDMECAAKAGIRGIQFSGGNLFNDCVRQFINSTKNEGHY